MTPHRVLTLARRAAAAFRAGKGGAAGHDADDLAQEAAAVIWAALLGGESRESHLVTLARSRLIDLVRRTPQPRPSAFPEQTSREDDPAARAEARDAVRAALRSLPRRWRAALALRRRGWPDGRIAERLGLTAVHVRVMRHRARRAVLRHLEGER